jgi:NADPH:quinone reductase-like Zn-dependent oxidoreductase
MEAAGVVLDIGPGVHGILPGDRVAYACAPPGAYAEVRTMKAELLVVLPDDIGDELAAAVMLKGMSAEFLLHRVHRVREGDHILVHAAAGGVGQLLCQWGRALGATVIGTVGSIEKARIARSHGCAYPIVYTEEDFVERVREITKGEGCQVVYDAVGRDTFLGSFEALAIRGHLVSYGQASGPIEPVDISSFVLKSALFSRPNFGHYTGTASEVRSITDRLFDALRRGILHVEIGQRYALRDAVEANRRRAWSRPGRRHRSRGATRSDGNRPTPGQRGKKRGGFQPRLARSAKHDVEHRALESRSACCRNWALPCPAPCAPRWCRWPWRPLCHPVGSCPSRAARS